MLDAADDAKRRPHAFGHLLEGDTVVTYFTTPSTRTRLSLATAIARLGGAAQVVGPSDLQLGRGETIEDTAAAVSRYARAFFVRTFADDDVRRFADAASIPVVNALTDGHHPLQALADLQTMRERFGRLAGLHLAYVGDGNNVCHSLLEACALAGVDVSVATPPGFEPDPAVVEAAQDLAIVSGAIVRAMHDPYMAVYEAHAVYTDTWISLGTPEEERAARAVAFEPFRVDDSLMFLAHASAIFMHCLPAHRGEEVTASVIDGPRSVVLDQAENRLHTSTAVLRCLLQRTLTGADDRALVLP